MTVTTTTPKQYTTAALLAILSIILCGLSSSTLVSASSSLLTDPDNNDEQLDFKLLLPRSILEGKLDTNDEEFVTVPFHTFSLTLKGIPADSELAKSTDTPINNSNPRSAIINAIQLFVNTKGYEAFENNEEYNERFFDMNVGSVYSMLYTEGGKDLPWSRRNLRARALQETTPTTTGTSKITLGHEGQTTFTGLPHYYEDDPTSTDVTDFVVTELNKPENLLELQDILKPMVCTQTEISTNSCYLEVGGFSSDVVVETDEETIDKSEIGDDPNKEDTSKLAWIIPVVVGSSLLAIAIISLLFIKHRNKSNSDDDMMQHAVEVKASNTAESEEFTEEVEVTASGDIMSKDSNGSNIASWAGAKSPLAAMAAASTLVASTTSSARSRSRSRSRSKSRSRSSSPSNEDESTSASISAYDAIMSPGLTSSVATASSPPTAAAIVGTAAVAAAVASKQSSEKEEEEEKKSKKTKNIDNILDDFDDSSSFITDSSADNTSVSGSVSTGYIGLIAENQPLDDVVHTSSRLSQVSTDNSAVNGGGGGYLPKSLTTKEGKTTQKQESFEDDYRTRSAMAKLNLKKDILHVACETHDAPTDAATTGDLDDEDPNAPLIGSSATAAGVANGSKGVSRTISAKKNTSMLDAQRISDKLSMKGYSKRSSKKGSKDEMEEDKDSSKDMILPVDFQRSDSVGDIDSEDGSSGSDEETTTDYSTLA